MTGKSPDAPSGVHALIFRMVSGETAPYRADRDSGKRSCLDSARKVFGAALPRISGGTKPSGDLSFRVRCPLATV